MYSQRILPPGRPSTAPREKAPERRPLSAKVNKAASSPFALQPDPFFAPHLKGASEAAAHQPGVASPNRPPVPTIPPLPSLPKVIMIHSKCNSLR